MARRNDHSREQLYDMALDAARQVVEEDGFRALTARNVADAIGYSPGTLYNIFSNLDDLILHLNGSTLDSLHAAISRSALSGNPYKDLEQLLEAYLGFLESHPSLWRAITDYSLPEGAGVPEWYGRKVDKVLSVVESAIAPAYGNHNEARETPMAAARVLWAGLHGICSLSDAGKLDVLGTASVRNMAKILATNFIAGVEARRSRNDFEYKRSVRLIDGEKQ